MKILYLSPYLVNSDSNQKVTWTKNLMEHLVKNPGVDISLATVSPFTDKDYSFKENDGEIKCQIKLGAPIVTFDFDFDGNASTLAGSYKVEAYVMGIFLKISVNILLIYLHPC